MVLRIRLCKAVTPFPTDLHGVACNLVAYMNNFTTTITRSGLALYQILVVLNTLNTVTSFRKDGVKVVKCRGKAKKLYHEVCWYKRQNICGKCAKTK